MLSRLDAEDCPPGVPLDLWEAFIREADAIRARGRDHYSARTILEVVRHHRAIAGEADYRVNNNHQAAIARTYVKMRGCYRFFEIRDRKKKKEAA